MTAEMLTGRPVADAIWAKVDADAKAFEEKYGRKPTMAVIKGDNEGAHAYARSVEKIFARHGLGSDLREPAKTTAELRALLTELSNDDKIDGVLVLTPVPDGCDVQASIDALDPDKDVDGQHPASLGKLVQKLPTLVPSTPLGGLRLMQHYGVELKGKRVTIVGRSAVVGLPLSLMLLAEDATVTICHSRTKDLVAECARAEVLCVAIGRAGMIGPEHVAPGAVVIDFGTNEGPDGKLVGDVQTAAVAEVASRITPVPGGAGVVTVAVIAEQVVTAANKIKNR